MSADPDELLEQLRQGGTAPPLVPLHIDPPAASARPGPAGWLVDRLRGGLLRLLSPTLGRLIAQLERDRHRQRAELERLAARVERLEADRN